MPRRIRQYHRAPSSAARLTAKVRDIDRVERVLADHAERVGQAAPQTDGTPGALQALRGPFHN